MRSRPWTPGPWRWIRSDVHRCLVDESRSSVIPCIEWIPGTNVGGNDDLIALAPKMAEWILEVTDPAWIDDLTESIPAGYGPPLRELADELRAIGASDA